MSAGARALAAAALAAATALTSASAPAQSLADKASAQKLLTQGNQLVQGGEYLPALERFRAAYALFPSAKILLNIGATLRQLGRNVEAAEVYEQYLRDPQMDRTRIPVVRQALYELEYAVGKIRIQVNREDARVRVDGKELSAFHNGDVTRVEPGEHSIVASREGFPDAVVTVRVAPHEERPVSLTLEIPPPERVFVQGPQRTIAYVVGAVGVGGLIAGGVAGLVALLKNNAATQHCEKVGAAGATQHVLCDQTGYDLGRTAKTSALVSTVALTAGGAAVVSGVVLYFTVPKPSDAGAPAGPRLSAALSASGASLRFEGSW